MRIAPADAAATTAAAAFDPSLRWCLLEYGIDDDDIGREPSRYVSLSAPKAILKARRALADAKAVHLDDVRTLELELDDAEQRWSKACRQKLQALRVKLTEMHTHAASDARELASSELQPGSATDSATNRHPNVLANWPANWPANWTALAPYYFIYLAPDGAHTGVANAAQLPAPPTAQWGLRARNYLGRWLLEDDVEVDALAVARCGWPLPAFQRWIQGVVATRRKPSREEGIVRSVDCVLAAGHDFCLAMDLQTFTMRSLAHAG